MSDAAVQLKVFQKTRLAFMWTSILTTPFWAIFNMLPYILYKDLHATPLQITSIVILKPAVSLLALYWSSLVEKRKDRLLSNLIWARILGHLPFFFFPFVDNVWFFIASFGFYMMLARGTVPAWMEVLKLNLPDSSREKIYAHSSTFGYLGTGLLPFMLGGLMDNYVESWRWIFPFTALISLVAILFKRNIPIALSPSDFQENRSLSFFEQIKKPWKSAWDLLKRRPDFARYQLGFMLGGSGLIIMQPALPVFFIDGLNLSYTELAVALTLCKGIGFAMASGIWAKFLNKIDIYRFNSWVTLLAFIFPLFLIAAQVHASLLYCGYLLYGVMQAGSEMSWNLSGPLFAKREESSVYSSVNVMTVGLRGCFIPAIGALLLSYVTTVSVMLLGGILCLFAALSMSLFSRKYVGRVTN